MVQSIMAARVVAWWWRLIVEDAALTQVLGTALQSLDTLQHA